MGAIATDLHDGIMTVTLNRPEALNAIDDTMNRELAAAWDEFAARDEAAVAVVRGAGKNFSAGADLKTWIPKWEHACARDLDEAVAEGLGGGLTRGRHRMEKPVIAAVHGHAVGAGFELALACDLRIAARSAVFGVFEMRHGLHQGDGGIVRLARLVGLSAAMDLTLTGRAVDAEEALRLGIVSRVVPDDVLEDAVMKTAQAVAGAGAAAVSAKKTLLETLDLPLDDALEAECRAAYGHAMAHFPEIRKRLGRYL